MKAKEALEFYAADRSYDSRHGLDIMKDAGDKAKEALEELDELIRENQQLKQELEVVTENLELEHTRLLISLTNRDRRIRQAVRMLRTKTPKYRVIDFLREKNKDIIPK